jgi:hypothetical protein
MEEPLKTNQQRLKSRLQFVKMRRIPIDGLFYQIDEYKDVTERPEIVISGRGCFKN